MQTDAIVFERPGMLDVRRVSLSRPGDGDIVAETLFSGISTGTEKLLYEGAMPSFPGMGYPLVPGYESVARVVEAGPASGRRVGETIFVPGASCYTDAAGLFGANAARLVVASARTVPVDPGMAEEATLLALAATAHNAVSRARQTPGLVIGHGVVGRLVARIVTAQGHEPPTVWETAPERRDSGGLYPVIDPSEDTAGRYAAAIEASGNMAALDAAIARLGKGGEVVLAGFYGERVSFGFVPAFMREISVSIAAEFRPADIQAVLSLIEAQRLSLAGLITHHAAPQQARTAYRTAFTDRSCLKMVIDWRNAA